MDPLVGLVVIVLLVALAWSRFRGSQMRYKMLREYTRVLADTQNAHAWRLKTAVSGNLSLMKHHMSDEENFPFVARRPFVFKGKEFEWDHASKGYVPVQKNS